MGTGKKMLQAITNLVGRWKTQEEAQTLQQAYARQYASQMQNASPSWAVTMTTTTNTTSAWPNLGMSFGMGGAGGTTLGSGYTYTQSPSPTWSLTDDQLNRLLAFMERAMHYSWTCVKCQRQYAPITPDCEFCNFVERLEGQKDEAA